MKLQSKGVKRGEKFVARLTVYTEGDNIFGGSQVETAKRQDAEWNRNAYRSRKA